MKLEECLENIKDSDKRLETLRILRNLVTQECIENLNTFLNTLCPFLNKEFDELTRRLTWQVIYNNCVAHSSMIQPTIEHLEPQILDNLEIEVLKTQNVICALIYLKLDSFLHLFPILLNIPSDFALLATTAMLEHDQVLDQVDKLDNKLTVYELCQDLTESQKLDSKTLKFLVESFKRISGSLLTTFIKDSTCPIEASRLLLILCKGSTMNEKHQQLLQNDKSLLIDAIYLLKMMHESQRSKGQLFTKETQVEDSPINGFKCNLIRLIGNLCYENQSNQDQVREVQGLELILDCSPLDIRNPMITQWVVFAIRNLCQNNPENQQVILQMDKKGQRDKEVLKQYGIDIHDFQ